MRLWRLPSTAFLLGWSRPGKFLSHPSQRGLMTEVYDDDKDGGRVLRGPLSDKPEHIACIAPEIERLLTKADDHRAAYWGAAVDDDADELLVSADGEIRWPSGLCADDLEQAEALMARLSWASLAFTLSGQLPQCRLWQSSPHRPRLEALYDACALEVVDDEEGGGRGDLMGPDQCRRLVSLCVCLAEVEMALQQLATVADPLMEEEGQAGGDAGEGGGGGGRKLLKDLLQHPDVMRQLPGGMQVVLGFLLLPRGLNLRNLLWHGFFPPRLHRRYWALVLLLLLNLPTPGRTGLGRADVAWRGSVAHRLAPQVAALSARLTCSSFGPALTRLVRASGFILPGAEELVLVSWQWYAEGRPLLGALGLVLVLEQSLRRCFAVCNGRPEHFWARSKQYYTTLDGFGQRDRHQLLLAPELVGVGEEEEEGGGGGVNLLLWELGCGYVSALLDLFLLEAGPGLRSKLAHGGIDPLAALASPHAPCPATQLLLVLFLALCWRYTSDTAARRCLVSEEEPTDDAPRLLSDCHTLLHTHYRSYYHPRALLRRAVQGAVGSVSGLCGLMRQRGWRLEETEEEGDGGADAAALVVRIQPHPPSPPHTSSTPLEPAVLRVVDRAERLAVWQGGPQQQEEVAEAVRALQPWARSLRMRLLPLSTGGAAEVEGPSTLTAALLTPLPAERSGDWLAYPQYMWPATTSPSEGAGLPPPPPPLPSAPMVLVPSSCVDDAPPLGSDDLLDEEEEEALGGHWRLSSVGDVTRAPPPLQPCALQLVAGVASIAAAFSDRLQQLEALVLQRRASTAQRRLYQQTLYVLPAAVLLLTCCLQAVEAHAMAHHHGDDQGNCGDNQDSSRSAGPGSAPPHLLPQGPATRVPLTALLNELLSFRRCVVMGRDDGEETAGGGACQRRTYAEAFGGMAKLVTKAATADKKKKASRWTRRGGGGRG